MSAPREILILKFEALGDVLRTTSLLQALRAQAPSRIRWITTHAGAELLANNPDIEEVVPLDLNDPAAAQKVERRFKKRFDLVLSLEEHPTAARIAQSSVRGELVGVCARSQDLAYTPSSAPYYDMSLLNRDPDGGLEKANALKAANRASYAHLWLGILGIQSPTRKPVLALSLLEEDRRIGKNLELGGKKPVLALNPGAGARWPSKQLSEEKAARILLALDSEFRGPLLLVGGADEVERNRRIAARAQVLRPGIRPILPGRVPLRSFAGILERCDAVITTDSLALHVAAGVRRPAVALVGPTSAHELDFFGKGHALAPSSGCDCLYKARCARQEPCLDDIPDGDVISGTRTCLA